MRWIVPFLFLVVTPAWAQDSGIEDVLRGAPPLGATQTEGTRPAAKGHGFREHVREAMTINQARRSVYKELSGGVSSAVSSRLILSERLTIPIAKWFDGRARAFNERGVGIVRDDFTALDDLPPADQPSDYRGRASQEQHDELCALLKDYHEAYKADVAASEFEAAAERTRVTLHQVIDREERWGVHWAMTKHILEQVGYVAERATGYVAQDPKVEGLTKRFMRVLTWGLLGAASMDREAQKSHQLGVGVLVNDLPPIDFH